jgi:AcrR family transcriptional regulator
VTNRELRKQQITARRQEQILNAALELFGQKGYASATIPAIAKMAGVAAGTIYLYYPGKRELFTAVIEKQIVAPLVSIFSRESDNFSVTLKGALEDRFRILQNNVLPRLLPLLGEVQADPQLRALILGKVTRPLLSRMEDFYRPRIAAGEFRAMEPAITVRLIGSLMLGMGLLRSIERESSPLATLPPEKVIEEVLNFILHGVMNSRKMAP